VIPSMSNLLEVAQAPAGTSLARGIWFTHDLNLQVVANHIASALVDTHVADGAERLRRTLAFRTMLSPPELVVVADGRRMHSGPGIPWIRIVPVFGRVQHAKFGVLEFAHHRPGKANILRAFVTSANLTRNGVATNREFLIAEQRTVAATSPSLLGDLVHAIREFINSVDDDEVAPAKRQSIDAVLSHFANRRPHRLGAIRHSLDAKRPILPERIRSQVADEVDIVSPPFASGTDARVVTHYLAPWLQRDGTTTVRWHVDREDDGRALLPRAAWQQLRRRSDTTAFIIDDTSKPQRRLHAKLIALSTQARTFHLAGSANFTSRGLGGLNRELVVWWSTKRSANVVVTGLPSHQSLKAPRFTQHQDQPPDERRAAVPELRVVFATRNADGSLVGRIELAVLPGRIGPVQVRIAGRWRPVSALTTELVPLGAGLLLFRFPSHRVLNVPVDLSAIEPDLWLQPGDRSVDSDPDLQALEALLGELASRHRARSREAWGSNRRGLTGADDRYIEALTQPLVKLARYRHALREKPSAQLEEILAGIDDLFVDRGNLWDPKVEGEIARTLLGLPTSRRSLLLNAVREAK